MAGENRSESLAKSSSIVLPLACPLTRIEYSENASCSCNIRASTPRATSCREEPVQRLGAGKWLCSIFSRRQDGDRDAEIRVATISFASHSAGGEITRESMGDHKPDPNREVHKLAVPLQQRACIGALAGGIAGGITNVALHPIDTVKTKLQTRGASKVYSGPWDVVVKLLKSEGIGGFYKGVSAAFLGSIISSSIYFGTYEMGKGILSNISSCPHTLIPPLAAAIGNITSSAVLVPKEVIKQRMQAEAIGSASDVFFGTIRREGIGDLYAGYSAALLRNLPTNIISFSTFEYLKYNFWLVDGNKSALEPWQSMTSGALAGALSAAVTTPLDVVKTRLMTQARDSLSFSGLSGVRAEAAARAKAVAAYTYTGVSSTMQQIWTEEGLRGLLKGVIPRVLYSALFSAMGFFAFETTKAFFLAKHLESLEAQKKLSASKVKAKPLLES